MDKVEIRPTILEVPKNEIEESLNQIENLVSGLHIDVEDGIFVPRVNDFSHHFVGGIKMRHKFQIDTHLMVSEPLDMVEDYIKNGSSIVSFHFESKNHPKDVIKKIISFGAKACLALKLETDVYLTKPFWDNLEEILLMAVNPGWGGQSLDPQVLTRIKDLRQLGWKGKIKIDGGVTAENAYDLVKSGADVLVAGTALFGRGNIETNYSKLIESI